MTRANTDLFGNEFSNRRKAKKILNSSGKSLEKSTNFWKTKE